MPTQKTPVRTGATVKGAPLYFSYSVRRALVVGKSLDYLSAVNQPNYLSSDEYLFELKHFV
jgi:hypothetical protein